MVNRKVVGHTKASELRQPGKCLYKLGVSEALKEENGFESRRRQRSTTENIAKCSDTNNHLCQKFTIITMGCACTARQLVLAGARPGTFDCTCCRVLSLL